MSGRKSAAFSLQQKPLDKGNAFLNVRTCRSVRWLNESLTIMSEVITSSNIPVGLEEKTLKRFFKFMFALWLTL